MIIFGKSKQIYNKIDTYLKLANELMMLFQKTNYEYLENYLSESFEFGMQKIKKQEENCDSILHSIQKELYKKSLLPEFREDILILLEKIDDIIDQALDSIEFLFIHDIKINPKFHNYIKEIIQADVEAFNFVKIASKEIFLSKNNIKEHAIKISNFETICDNIELKTIREIYISNDLSDIEKIITEKAIYSMTKISDFCDDTAEILTLINVKKEI